VTANAVGRGLTGGVKVVPGSDGVTVSTAERPLTTQIVTVDAVGGAGLRRTFTSATVGAAEGSMNEGVSNMQIYKIL